MRLLLSLFLLLSLLGSASAVGMNKLDDRQIQVLTSSVSPLVIHFWATWCEPCRVEIPALNRLSEKYKSTVQFVAINMDDVENRGAIASFLKKHPIHYRVALWDGKDFEAMTKSVDPDWKQGLPATFVFHNRKRVFGKVGMLDEKELDNVLQQLQQTLSTH